MKRLSAMSLIFMFVMSACTVNDSGKSPVTWQQQYDLGIRYLSEGNYEEAIIAFTTAIEIDAKQASAFVGRGDSYVGVAQLATAAAGDSEELPQDARDAYENAIQDYLASIELDSSDPDTYLKAADAYTELGNIDAVIDILDQGYESTGDETLIAKKKALEESRQLDYNYRSRFESLYDCMVNKNYFDLVQLSQEVEFELEHGIDYTGICYDGKLVTKDLTGYGLCISLFESKPFIYLGNLENGIPNGEGTNGWYSEFAAPIVYSGMWANGLPNGAGVRYLYESETDFNSIEGNWIDGYIDGEVIYKEEYYYASTEYRYACSMGKVVIDDRWIHDDLTSYPELGEWYIEPVSGDGTGIFAYGDLDVTFVSYAHVNYY